MIGIILVILSIWTMSFGLCVLAGLASLLYEKTGSYIQKRG